MLNVDKLRFELFKFYYATQNEFDLHKKADSSELLQQFLELFHLSLNISAESQTVDSICKPKCMIHRNTSLGLVTEKTCQCNPHAV